MSLGIGVSDILYLVSKTLTLYEQCRDAPAELQAAGRNVEEMHTALKILRSAVTDEKSFIAREPGM